MNTRILCLLAAWILVTALPLPASAAWLDREEARIPSEKGKSATGPRLPVVA